MSIRDTIHSVNLLVADVASQNFQNILDDIQTRFEQLTEDKQNILHLQSIIRNETNKQGMTDPRLQKLETDVGKALDQNNELLILQQNERIKTLTYRVNELQRKFNECVDGVMTKDSICTEAELKEITTYSTIILQLSKIGDIVLKSLGSLNTRLTMEEQAIMQQYQDIEPGVQEWITIYQTNPTILTDCSSTEFLHLIENGKLYFDVSKNLLAGLKNLYEDLSGATRVYVRIKPSDETASFVPFENQTIKCVAQTPNTVYGPYFNVIPPSFNNISLYFGEKIESDLPSTNNTECSATLLGICRSARLIINGYHLVLFASGISGSGKTLTLFGNDSEPGISEIIISDVVSNTSFTPKIECIMELCIGDVSFLERAGNRGKVINLMGSTKTLNPEVNMPKVYLDNTEHDALKFEMSQQRINPDALRPGDIAKLRKILDDYRLKRGRIAATPNNPTSSRSHLLIIISVGKGLLTILDSAGTESPISILDSFWSKPTTKGWFLPSLLTKSPVVQNYIVDKETGKKNLEWRSTEDKKIIGKVLSVIKSGIWISYSLIDLQTFFLQQKNLKSSANIASFPIDRDEEYNSKNALQKTVKQKTDTIGMFSLLTTLKNLRMNLDGSRTKFVLLSCVRTESKYIEITNDSLKFSQSISS